MKTLFTKIVDVKPDEIRALWLAFVFNFVVLAGYYILRPIREEIGATSGVENLPWMFTATLVGMLIANALFAAIVSRMSRRKFLPLAYRFAIANLFIFFVLMRFVPANWQWLLARSFFVWVSVFNLFATTLFWAFMTDLFTAEQGKRLFGFIAVGGSLGAILGPLVPTFLVDRLSTGIFCLMSAAMFEIAAQCIRFFPTEFREHAEAATARKTNRRKYLGQRHTYRAFALLVRARPFHLHLHADKYMGLFSTGGPHAGMSWRISRPALHSSAKWISRSTRSLY